MKKTASLGLIAAMLVLGFVSCGDELPDELAGTTWNGRRETPHEFSYEITDGKFIWSHERRYNVLFEKTDGAYEGGSLADTTWRGRWIYDDGSYEEGQGGHTLEFIDETTAVPSWERLDTITYTLDGATINFVYTSIREHTLIFEENSNFRNSNSSAVGTYTIRGSNLTLTGNWVSSDIVGEDIDYAGIISGNTITLNKGSFYGVVLFNKEE